MKTPIILSIILIIAILITASRIPQEPPYAERVRSLEARFDRWETGYIRIKEAINIEASKIVGRGK